MQHSLRFPMVWAMLCGLALLASEGWGTGVASACDAPAVVAINPRYIEVTPADLDPTPVAILVVQSDFDATCTRYFDFDANPALAALGVARPVSEPVFRAPSEWGTLFLRAPMLVPEGTYRVYADCGTVEAPDLSPTVIVTMYKWGDVVGSCDVPPCTPPNGVTDFIDISAIVEAFKHIPTAPATHRVDLMPSYPDYVIDFVDIAGAVDGFRGINYVLDDCNGNLVWDTCDIEDGTSGDCDFNGVPDECDPDCDGDGIPDACDTWEDCDEDGVHDCWDLCPCTNPPNRSCVCPDFDRCCWPFICIDDYPREICLAQGGVPDCTLAPCRSGCLIGDFDSDGDLDSDDAVQVQACYSGPDIPFTGDCLPADFDDDTDVDCDDWAQFKEFWTEPGDPPYFATCDGL